VASATWASGKYAELIRGLVRDLIDRNHLADRSPLASPAAFRAQRARDDRTDRTPLRKRLADQKTPQKLPDAMALWELVRIVFTEEPRTFADVIRFAQCRILVLCGLRIEEICSLPADWSRTREYLDMEGRPAGLSGGVSRSLMIRHFAEKQRGEGRDGVERHESFQHVPEMFDEIVETTLSRVWRITERARGRGSTCSDRSRSPSVPTICSSTSTTPPASSWSSASSSPSRPSTTSGRPSRT
jgi:hypothetical protein